MTEGDYRPEIPLHEVSIGRNLPVETAKASTPENTSETEVGDFTVRITKENFGRGDIEVVQMIPSHITTEEARRQTRKQIFMPGYNLLRVDEHRKLMQDLQILAAANKEEGGEPMICVGVSFTGRRANDKSRVEGLPEGVDVRQFQYNKALDFMEASNALVDGTNAEVIGFSIGGATAQLSVVMGLRADTVGLFNSSGFRERSSRSMVPKKEQIATRRITTKVKSRSTIEVHTSERKDRLRRLFAERWGGSSSTYPLLGIVPETRYIVANGEKDFIHPKKKVRQLVDRVHAPNVQLVDLDWKGHSLGGEKKLEQRKERLRDIVKVMHEGREQTSSPVR